mgnify:CR=1 FL=1
MTEVLTREKKAAWTAWRSAYKSGTGRKILRQAGRILLGAAPGFALAFSDICGVSTGAWAAYGMAAASCGMMSYPVSLGIAAAFLMRLLWGLTTRWELLIGAVLVLLSPHVLRQKNGAFPLIATGLALLPGAIIGVWQGSAATLLFGIGTILLGTLSAPVMRRAIESIRGGRSFETLESRLSVGYLLLMLLCGGARMMLPYINLGVTAAGLMTMAAAVFLIQLTAAAVTGVGNGYEIIVVLLTAVAGAGLSVLYDGAALTVSRRDELDGETRPICVLAVCASLAAGLAPLPGGQALAPAMALYLTLEHAYVGGAAQAIFCAGVMGDEPTRMTLVSSSMAFFARATESRQY